MRAVLTRNDTGEEIVLPTVTQVEDASHVSLTEMETIVYGAENRFVIDLGTKRSVTLTCVRANPSPWSDADVDPAMWSNGQWWTWFVGVIDEWQVLMGSAGGFTFELTPDDATAWPEARGNVMIMGATSPTFGVQTMKFSVPLEFSVVDGTAVSTEKITVTYRSDRGADALVWTVETTSGHQTIGGVPSGWGDVFLGASLFAWETEDGTQYTVGGSADFTEDVTLYAVWREAEVHVLQASERWTVPTVGDWYPEYRAVMYLVGAGGGAGGCEITTYLSGSESVFDLTVLYAPGGGGGAGAVTSVTTTVYPGNVIVATVGAGGAGGGVREDDNSRGVHEADAGGDGGTTSVAYFNTVWEAAGGKGGAGGRAPACASPDDVPRDEAGWADYVAAGGLDGYAASDGTGGDTCRGGDTGPTIGDTAGHTGDGGGVPGGQGAPVRYATGMYGDNVTQYEAWAHSAGGGASLFNHRTADGAVLTSEGGEPSLDYTGVGGDGAYGGGGGSGHGGGGKGGDGVVVVVLFEA